MKNMMDVNKAVRMFPVLQSAKVVYMSFVERFESGKRMIENDTEKEMIELYHGTTASRIPQIMKEGLKPNLQENNKWDNEIRPLNNVIYATDRWQYYYSSTAFIKENKEKMSVLEWDNFYREVENHVRGIEKIKGIRNNFPVYIKIRVNKSRVIADEDFFLSSKMNNKIEKALKERGIVIPPYDIKNQNSINKAFEGKIPQDIKFYKDFGIYEIEKLGEESLKFNGTAAVLGGVLPEDIIEIRCLPSLEAFKWSIIDENSKYHKAYITWQEGHGAKDIQKAQIRKMEDSLPVMDIKLDSNLQNIEKISVDYDAEKVIVEYRKTE